MKFTLNTIRSIAVECQAVVAQKALGFRIDRKLNEIANLCLDRIKYELPGGLFTPGSEEEIRFWNTAVEDFDFEPIELKFTEDLDARFTQSNIDIINGNLKYSMNPYSAFFDLVNQGFIIINE